MTGSLQVVAAGPLTLVQDSGRPGLAAIGVGRSGAADRGSARLADRLVGNDPAAAVLEVLSGGLVVRFTAHGVLALTGAELPADLSGRTVPPRTAVPVYPGEVLRTGPAVRGLRGYLAVRGGVAVPAVLGSRSTDQLSGIGPPPVRAGAELPVGDQVIAAAQPWSEPAPEREDPVVLRLLPGPRDDWFGPAAARVLTEGVWSVSADSNRVAVRLSGPAVPRVGRGELPSEPLVPGAVQVPPDGQPVVFGADHPVTGGYPVVGVVDPAGVDAAAQLRPGDRVRFGLP